MNKKQIISLTFDDGWASQYTNALPIMNQFEYRGTFYIITSWLEKKHPSAMLPDHVIELYNQEHEIGSHTITHPSLPFNFWKNKKDEIQKSKTILEELIGGSVKSFAYPYGRYNSKIIDLVKDSGYQNARAVDGKSKEGYSGFNFKIPYPFEISCQSVKRSTTLETVRIWIEMAKRNNFWLVLNFHQVDEKPYAWGCKPDMFRNICQMIKDYNAGVVPLSEGLELYYS